MKYLLIISTLIFTASPVFSQINCGFEPWQLEYFAFSDKDETLDFLTSAEWRKPYSSNSKKEGYITLSRNFSSEKGHFHFLDSQNIVLRLITLPAECWVDLRSNFDLNETDNLFFEGINANFLFNRTSKVTSVKNKQNNNNGFIEFHTSNNNSRFDIIIYDSSTKKLLANIDKYESEINLAKSKIINSDYLNAKKQIERSINILKDLSINISDTRLLNNIVNNFYDNNTFNLKIEQLNIDGTLTKLDFDLSDLIRYYKNIISKINQYLDYKKSNKDDSLKFSFEDYLLAEKSKEVKLIRKKITKALNSNTAIIWKLKIDPIKTEKCYSCSDGVKVYPYISWDGGGYYNNEIEPMPIISRPTQLTLSNYRETNDDLFIVFTSDAIDHEIIVNIAEALYNESITYQIIN